MVLSFRRLIVLSVVVLASAVVFFVIYNGTSPQIVSPRPPETAIPERASVQSSDSTSQVTVEKSKVHSPDGKMRLFMEKTIEEAAVTYVFSVSDESEADKKVVFTKTLPREYAMRIPLNSFSPDNKYFFIKEEGTDSVDYLVFKASGEVFSEGEQYISVVPLFVARDTEYNFSETTGWDSETLLHVYTTKAGGSKGPSFWFEVPSKEIIQLASR